MFSTKICMPCFKKKLFFSENLPPPCCTVVTDDEEDMTVRLDDFCWLLTIDACWSVSFTAGVAGQIATCGTARAACGGACCCCCGLDGCGGNSPDFVACFIVVPVYTINPIFLKFAWKKRILEG